MKNIFRLSVFLFFTMVSLSAVPRSADLVIPLWEQGAPGSEDFKDQAEKSKDWWYKNIHNPSLNVFFPEEGTSNGTALVVFPGGGHRELVFNPEGRDAAPYFNAIGTTVIVVKYRLFAEPGSPYSRDDTRADALRAMRLVRHHAKEWGLRKDRIGMMGFSAGGEHVSMVSFGPKNVGTVEGDPVDNESAEPDFAVWVYTAPYGIPEELPENAPPAFFVVAIDDPWDFEATIKLLGLYRKAGIPAEAHVYASGNHGFNLGQRSELRSLHSWPDRLNDWMLDYGWVEQP